MKSLYAQIVVTFLCAILIGLVVTFALSGRLHGIQMSDKLKTEMITIGKEFITLYKTEPDFDSNVYLDGMSAMSFDVLFIQDGSDTPIYQNEEEEWNLEQEEIEHVLGGGVHNEHIIPNRVNVGIPFEHEGSTYALFLKPDFEFFFQGFRQLILVLFGTILLIGSVVFIVSTRWIVRPIQAMTDSSKELAKGNFHVEVQTKRKDELGNLAQNFNQMAQGLGELDQMRQQFVSNVSHEIQSPLTSIQGFARALKDGVVQDEESKQAYYDIIENESKRLSTMSQHLLKLASLDTEHPPFEPRTYALDEQLRRVLAATEPQWSQKDITVEVDVKPVFYTGDADQLEQVWVNLLTNAIRHTPVNGEIRVTLQPEPETVRVTISDNGEGISPEDQQRIFERFYKVDKSHTRKQGGSGLGLSIAERIVELHHGTIEVASHAGEGTAFTVTLPQPISTSDRLH